MEFECVTETDLILIHSNKLNYSEERSHMITAAGTHTHTHTVPHTVGSSTHSEV